MKTHSVLHFGISYITSSETEPWASLHSEPSNKVYILFVYMIVSSFSKVLSNLLNFHFLILMSEKCG